MSVPQHQFVAYIDESGDPGLKRVRPIDQTGSTEWMTISAVVVDRSRDQDLKQWVTEITSRLGSANNQVIHFKDLDSDERLFVAREVSELPLRLFVVASNKKNMRGHRNSKAEKVPSKQWFYNWLVRILMERVTDWCLRRSQRQALPDRHVKFVFSQSGGHSYSQTAAYHELLKYQSRGGATFLTKWVPRWEVMNMHLVEHYPHFKRAGLQIADIVASAFYQAVDNLDTGPCDGSFAEALRPRMALSINGDCHDYGVVLQPSPCWTAEIGADQRKIFEFYGYGFTRPWWAAGPGSGFVQD